MKKYRLIIDSPNESVDTFSLHVSLINSDYEVNTIGGSSLVWAITTANTVTKKEIEDLILSFEGNKHLAGKIILQEI